MRELNKLNRSNRRAKRFRLLLLALSCISLCSCTTTKPIPDAEWPKLKKHIIATDEDGRLLCPHSWCPTNNDYITDMVENIVTNCPTNKLTGKKQILIFAHGGLNTKSSANQRAYDTYQSITTDPELPAYPIYINWRSSLVSSYLEHLYGVRQGQKAPQGVFNGRRAYYSATAPVYLATDLATALIRTPLVWQEHYFSTDFKALTWTGTPYDKSHYGLSDKLVSYVSPEVRNANELRCGLTNRCGSATNGTIDQISFSLGAFTNSPMHRLWKGSKWIVTTPSKVASLPIVDGLGKSSWDVMLRRTTMLFHQTEEFDLSLRRDHNTNDYLNAGLDTDGDGSLARFFQALTKRIGTNINSYEVTLVGHSMGTIVMNGVLRHFPNLPVKNIVYMGAACTIRDFAETAIPYLLNHTNTQFFNLSLHPENELSEGYLFDLPIRGSLLEWIDDFLSSPNTPFERTLGKWENIVQSTQIFPKEIRPRIHIKGFGSAKNDPITHSDFASKRGSLSFPFWEPSAWQPDCPRCNRQSP